MNDDVTFEQFNEVKANMDHLYDQADPRAYFRELRRFGYNIPGAAKPIFQRLICSLQKKTMNSSIRILDVGCSYGVNAALLKHDLSIDDLYDHWGQEKLAEATPEEIIEHDRRFFDNLDEVEDIEVIGLDAAKNAVAFAEGAGLLDEGLAINLENHSLPEAVKEELATVDLVTSTGCIGYVTEKSFNRLLPAVSRGRKPWFANFVLRMFPFDRIEDVLTKAGYVTEKLEGRTFVQRKFSSVEEHAQALQQLRERGIEPTDKEAKGHLVAEFYLSRPKADAPEFPIDQLMPA